MSIGVGVIAVPAGVRSLGSDREVFWRQAGSGVNRAAFYLGRIMADAPKLVLFAFLFIAPLVAIAPWRAPVAGRCIAWDCSVQSLSTACFGFVLVPAMRLLPLSVLVL
jgi:hypothetical protein